MNGICRWQTSRASWIAVMGARRSFVRTPVQTGRWSRCLFGRHLAVSCWRCREGREKKGASLEQVIMIGIDLAKSSFHLHDAHGEGLGRVLRVSGGQDRHAAGSVHAVPHARSPDTPTGPEDQRTARSSGGVRHRRSPGPVHVARLKILGLPGYCCASGPCRPRHGPADFQRPLDNPVCRRECIFS